MAKKFKEIPCPFCGRIVRNTDKFCIFCGSKLQKSAQTPSKPSITSQERDEIDMELGTSETADSKKQRKNKSSKGKSAEREAIPELPEEIKAQLEAKMELAVLNTKKERLRDKLRELTDELDSHRYQYDIDYAKKVNLKLDAIKEIKNELFAEEEKLRNVLGPSGQFRMDELDTIMEIQREQLIELKRSYKRHKIKKNVYEQLKEEYADKFRSAESELQDLRGNIIRMLAEEKSKKTTFQNRISMLQARLKSGEIDEPTFNDQRNHLEKDIEQVAQKIKILEIYHESKKRSFFK